MKKTSKILAVLLALMLFLPVFAACGEDKAEVAVVEDAAESTGDTSATPTEPTTPAPTDPPPPPDPVTLPIPDGVAPQSLFSEGETPKQRGTWGRYVLGAEFDVTSAGVVSHLMAYIFRDHTGEMRLTLYNYRDDVLAEFVFNAGDYGAEGWVSFELEEPRFLRKGTYIVSLTTGYDANGGNLFSWGQFDENNPASAQYFPSGSENLVFEQGLYGNEDSIDDVPSIPWAPTNTPGVDLVFYPVSEW